MKTTILSLILVSIAALSGRSEQPPDELVKKLTAVIRQHCPEAQIEISEKGFLARQGTMVFTLHSTSKTGELFPKTYKEEGPNFRGFMLTVSLETGQYQGAAAIPQTLHGPYFPTFVDAPATENGLKHYWVTFSYGSRLDEKIKSSIVDALPKTKMSPEGPVNGNAAGR